MKALAHGKLNFMEEIKMKTNELDYVMSKKMFDIIAATRSGEDKKKNPYSYVISVVNEQFGIKGTVTHVSII